MGPVVDSRIKTSDVGIPLFQIISEVRATKHISSTEECSGWFYVVFLHDNAVKKYES